MIFCQHLIFIKWQLLRVCGAMRVCILSPKLWRIQTSSPTQILLRRNPEGFWVFSDRGLSGCNQSVNLRCSSYSSSFLVTLSVHPSLPSCPFGCHRVTIITYFISPRFHFWWRLARVAFLSLVTFISVRALLGCGATFFMAGMSWAICFSPAALSGPVTA